MIKNILLILFSLTLMLEAGCKAFISKDKEVSPVVTTEDAKQSEVVKKAKWEWEIAPEEEQVEEKKVEPVQSEFSYPIDMVKAEPYPAGKPEGEKIDITFNFQAADIKEVLNVILGEILRINYTLDRRVTGMITLHTTGSFYRDELLNIIQAMLNVNGYAMIKGSGLYQVIPIQETRSEAEVKSIGKGTKTEKKDVITQIVPLKHVAPQTIIPTIRGLLTKAGFVIAPNDTHALVISEIASNMDRLLKIIETYDVPFFAGKALKFYGIKHVDAESLAKDLESIAQTLGAMTKGMKMDIAFIPFQDTNKILVATNSAELFPSIDLWISNIDVHLKEWKPRLYIYKMQHEKAESIVPILTELFQDKIKPTAKPAGGAEEKGAKKIVPTAMPGEVSTEPMKIIADKNTNSVIIMALPADYQSIKSIIEAIDATPQQVLIEAVIAEVTLTDTMAHGVEYFFRQKGGTKEGGSISLFPGGVTTGTTPLLGDGTKVFTLNRDIDAIFSLLATETDVEILSTPHILVRDEQTAIIQVGQSEPIRSGTTQTTAGAILEQVQYRDTGTILTVTPRIGENEMVTLDITQEVSDAVPSTASNIDSPTFPIRKTETSLVIQSGHTIYLGGIIDIANEETIKKIPLLGDIPFIGNVFKSKDRSKEKTELMILITPHVISNISEADMMTKEFKDKLKSIENMESRVK